MKAKTISTIQALSGVLRVIARSRDLGLVPATDPRLAESPRCDVCNRCVQSGHLLQGDVGLGCAIRGDGPDASVEFKEWTLDRGEEIAAQYWVCKRCYALLPHDRTRHRISYHKTCH